MELNIYPNSLPGMCGSGGTSSQSVGSYFIGTGGCGSASYNILNNTQTYTSTTTNTSGFIGTLLATTLPVTARGIVTHFNLTDFL